MEEKSGFFQRFRRKSKKEEKIEPRHKTKSGKDKKK